MKTVLLIFHLLISCVLHDCATGSYGPCTDIEGWSYVLPPAQHGTDSDGCIRTRHKEHDGALAKDAQGKVFIQAYLKRCNFTCLMPYVPRYEVFQRRNEPDGTPCVKGRTQHTRYSNMFYYSYGHCQDGQCR
uniref:Putative salivary secreted protein n=1 Tax=Ornithodoros turicata TaxID=34597 RepID=A0A2R5LB06_9ACAR